MLLTFRLFAGALLAVPLVGLQSTPLQSQSRTEVLVSRALPAVVTISVATPSGARQGSGFLIDESGTVVTNQHVIEGATAARVKLSSGEVYDRVRVLAADNRRDIAILQIDGFGLPTLRLGNSDSVRVGAEVIAIGSPLGLENSVSTGIISGKRAREGFHWLQTTAAISPGSSGGPILNSVGNVIGVAVAGMDEGQNLNFAVPVNYVRGMVAGAKSSRGQELAALSKSPSQPGRATPGREDPAGLQPVNTRLSLDLSDFRPYTAEYEDRDQNGTTSKVRVSSRLTPDPEGSGMRIELHRQVEDFFNGRNIGRGSSRSIARRDDLAPLAYFYEGSWLTPTGDWKSLKEEYTYGVAGVRGFKIDSEEGTKTVDRALPPGTLAAEWASLAFLHSGEGLKPGRTVSIRAYDDSADEFRDVQFSVIGPHRVRDRSSGKTVDAIKVERTWGARKQLRYYSASKPHVLLVTEGSGFRSDLVKLQEP